MSIIHYIYQWLTKKDVRALLSNIKLSLTQLEKGEVLSRQGKDLLCAAITDVDRLEERFSYKKTKKTREVLPVSITVGDAQGATKTKETLLLAESSPEVLDLFQERLVHAFHVIHVENGTQALEMARETNPDIIIADAMLPLLNGYELCRMLKSSVGTSHIPVILMSALLDKENIIYGLESGANDYIVKPFDFDILKARLRNILQSREQLRQMVFTDTGVEETSYTSELDIEFLDKAKQIVEMQIDNPEFSINEFCGMLAMSRTSVYNKLKALTGQAPNDFIRIIRLNRGKALLLSKKYTVSEVSYRVGFTDSKYFSTSFKKQFGISPSKL